MTKQRVAPKRTAPAMALATRPAQTSLHARILADIRGRIISGEWPPGHRIPFETELCAQFGCSRMTVNKVLSLLARSGLIERRRKAGSFVALPRAQSAVLEIQDVKVEVEAMGLAYGYRRLDRAMRAATASEAADLGVAPGCTVIVVSCLHSAGGRPFCLERRIINLASVPSAKSEAFEDTAPGPWLIAHVPWSEARHVIRAADADAETAAMLAVTLSTACLVVERRTWASGRPVTQVKLTYPGALRELVAVFAPAS